MIKDIVFCITTFNRITYLEDCINTFMCTKSDKFNWKIIITDDGSTDGTIEYLEGLGLEINIPIIIIKNNKSFISRQTNSIFEVCKYLNYDFGFKVDDDVYFVEKGWDIDYIEAYKRYGFAHLVHYNPEHIKYKKDIKYGRLIGPCDAMHCMGCLYTFIPEMFDKVGYFDEDLFKTFGHGHQEWTLRCCRAGYNNVNAVYDVRDSHLKIKLKCPQTENNYITHKENVNRENWNKLVNVWKDPKIVYKKHNEGSKDIVAINYKFDIDDIELVNNVVYKNY